jgi:cytochrome c oxidase subunit 2
MSHSIQGSGASASIGPDLTHLASRSFLAATALPNTADNLKRWVADPPAIKPGTVMPAAALGPDELNALTAYLASLK